MIVRKSRAELETMREGGRITAGCLKMLASEAREGVTTAELDAMAEEYIRERGGRPEFKGYQGFPGSICASPNSMIVHGIPGKYRLEEGDILSIDVGTRFEGFVTDHATTVAIGQVPQRTQGLLEITRRCLVSAIEEVREGNRLGDIGHAIQSLAESEGYGVVRDLVSHGVGREMHEDPQIPNHGKAGTGPRLLTGMTFAIEPMITLGGFEILMGDDGWSIYTADGSLAAHEEHTVAVTEDGPLVMTEW